MSRNASHHQSSPSDNDCSEIDRSAFNTAFHELGIRWFWDAETYRSLRSTPCERSLVQRYINGEQPHLLRAYDAEFLTDAILAAKQRARKLMNGCPPSHAPRFNWADARWGEVGI